MYVHRTRLFLGIGLLVFPFAVAITLLQWLVYRAIDLVGVVTGQGAGAVRRARAPDRHDPDAPRPRARAGGDRVCPRRDRRGPTDRRRVAAYRLALRRLRPLLRTLALFVARLGGPDPDHVPDSRRALARGSLVPARARRRAGGPRGHLGPAPERGPRPRPLDQGRLARRRQRRSRPGRRPLARGGADLPHGDAVRAAQLRCRRRLRAGAPVSSRSSRRTSTSTPARTGELEPVERPAQLPAEIELHPS